MIKPGGTPLSIGVVALLHAALLWWMSTTLAREPIQVTPPAVVGQLVTQAPVREPEALPMEPEPPKPRPRPAPPPQPVPVPPAPEAPPSERAVTPPPPEPARPAPPVEAAPTSPPPAPAPAPRAALEPVIPPRSDAAFLNNPAPAYPALSRRLREQGRVLFDVYILADGSVGEIRLRRSSGFSRLDDAALDAVRRWRYVPAKRGDDPIPYWYVQPIEFTLS